MKNRERRKERAEKREKNRIYKMIKEYFYRIFCVEIIMGNRRKKTHDNKVGAR